MSKIKWHVCEWAGLDEDDDLRLVIESCEDGYNGWAYDSDGNEHPFDIPLGTSLEDAKILGEKFLETLS